MLDVLATECAGEIHLSLGMTTHDEEEKIVSLFEERGRAKDLVIYSSTLSYPVEFQEHLPWRNHPHAQKL